MKLQISRVFLGVIFLVMAVPAVPVLGQVGQISGEVKDAAGNPLQGVQIEIQGLDVKRNYKVKTDKNGKFIHAGVALQGSYRVIAEKEGFQTDYVEGVQASFGGGDRGTVNFTLKPGQSGPLAFELTDEQRAKLIKEKEDAEKKAQTFAQVQTGFKEGLALYEQGQYEEALSKFKEVAAKDESQPTVWAHMGNTYEKMKRYDEGIEAYQKATTLKPNDAALYQNLGNIYAAKGDTEQAKVNYEKAAQLSSALDPKGAATTYYNMGVTYINSGQSQEAADALKKAVAADPTHAEAHYQLGVTLLGLNEVEEAVTHFKRYLELSPTGPNAETAQALVDQLK